MDAAELDISTIEVRTPDFSTLGHSRDAADYAKAAFELMKELGQLVMASAALLPLEDGEPRPLNRNEAVRAGMLVRAGKLIVGVLMTSQARKQELLAQMMRPLTETSVNLMFLVSEHGTDEAHTDFIRSSLQRSSALHETIIQNIEEREGEELPIERRMLDSIDRTFEAVSMTLEDVPPHPKMRGWPITEKAKRGMSIRDRFEAIKADDLYEIFAGESHYVHGTWHDIYMNHLEVVEGGFEPDGTWRDIEVSALTVTGILLGAATEHYLYALERDDLRELIERVEMCVGAFRTVDELDELRLSGQAGGE